MRGGALRTLARTAGPLALVAGCLAWPLPAAAAEADAESPAQAPRPRVGLVLSGGGARGFAHIGVLKVLEELRVQVDVIAATSMGAIVGGAYAAGFSSEQLDRLVRATDWREIFARRAPRADLHFRRKEDDFSNLSDVEFGIGAGGLSLPRGAVSTQNLGLFLRALAGPVKEVNDLALLPIPFAAMATDLATGKLVVLQKGVTLSTALRASMSVPGAFAPIEVLGHPLVDGGLVRNLPVDVARAMGADVVIAVNVGTPLAPREKLTDVVAVTEQMLTILTEQNVERSVAELGPADVLITPDLVQYGSGDFAHGDAIRQAGEAAARAVETRLRELAVPEATFARFERARANPVREDRALSISEVEVEGLRVVDRDAVRAELDLPRGRKLTAAEIDRAVQRVFGRGDFEAVTYSLIDEPLGRRLVVTPYEKSWGYNALRFGGSVVTGLGSSDSFNLLAAHTWSWLNAAGAEWRNEVQIGEVRRVASEFYQPLGAGSRWFVLPRVWGRREEFDLFIDRRAVFTVVARQRGWELQAGHDFRGRATARVGFGRQRSDFAIRIGVAPLESHDETFFWRASLGIDTLDSLAFPRHGLFLLGTFVHYDDSQSTSGRKNGRSFDAVLPLTSGRNSAIVTLRRVETGLDVGERLGGPFNLTGTAAGEIAGERGALGRLFLVRNVSDLFGDLTMPIYAGATFEAGYARGGLFAGPNDVQRAVSIFMAVDSPIGPVYLLAGRTFGAGAALYLLWGRPR